LRRPKPTKDEVVVPVEEEEEENSRKLPVKPYIYILVTSNVK
jgi:hypothetical protein